MAEEQQNKYLGLYTILPSELSLQLAEVGLALVNINEQVRPSLNIVYSIIIDDIWLKKL